MSTFGFVASPVGHGLDTHRTWEALHMGCIVLTQSTPLDVMARDQRFEQTLNSTNLSNREVKDPKETNATEERARREETKCLTLADISMISDF